MNSKEALERVKNGGFITCKECNNQWLIGCTCCRNMLSKSKELDIIEKDLEIVECFKKIPKQDLREFIEWQIRYEKNLNTWLEGCNCDLGKEEPTKHLIKIKEWLDEKEKEERMEND